MSTHLHLSSSHPTTARSRGATSIADSGTGEPVSARAIYSLRRGYHSLLLALFIAAESVSPKIVTAYLNGSFILFFLGLADGRHVDRGERWFIVRQSLVLVLAILTLIWNSVLALLWVFGLIHARKGVAKPNIWIKILCHLTLAHWYLVMPLVFWIFSSKLELASSGRTGYQQSNSALIEFQMANQPILTWVLLSSSFVLALFGSFARNTIPTAGPLSSINPNLETVVFVLHIALVFLNQNVLTLLGAQSEQDSLESFSIAVSTIAGLIVLYFQTFWNQKTNSTYTRGFFQVNTIRVCSLVVSKAGVHPNPYQLAPFLVVCHLLVSRLMKNISHLTFLIRTNPFSRRRLKSYYYGVFMYENYQELSKMRQLTDEEKAEQLILSQIGTLILKASKGSGSARDDAQRYAKNKDQLLAKKIFGKSTSQNSAEEKIMSDPRQQLAAALAYQAEFSSKEPLWVFYQEMLGSNPTSTSDLLVLLQLQILFLVNSMTLVSKTFHLLGQSLGDYKTSSFEFFHLEQLFQARLTQLYSEEAEQELVNGGVLSSRSTKSTFGQLYRDMGRDLSLEKSSRDVKKETVSRHSLTKRQKWKHKMESKGSSPISVDIARVLSSKHTYLNLVGQTSNLLGIKHSVYSHLFENYTRSSAFLFERNANFRRLSRILDRDWSQFVSARNVPLFTLVAAVNYFLKARNDIRRAELIFKAYRDRLLALDSYHGALGFEIDNATLYQNAVAMRVNMTKGMGFGGILDISANYVEHLGVPEDQDESRMSINGFFPGEFAKLHLKFATEIQDTKIFNKTSEFQVNGFDGFLRPVKFLLKLSSSLGQGINTMAMLKFREKSRQRLLIADEDLNILSAEVEFWEDMENIGLNSPVTSLHQLSKSLALHVNILKYLHLEEDDDEGVNDKGNSNIGEDNALENNGGQESKLLNPNMIPSRLEAPGSSFLGHIAKGIQTFSTYTKTKQKVLEQFYSTRRCGILHSLNPDLGLPIANLTIPIACTAEKWTFKDMPYYRVWVAVDSHLSRNTKTTGTDFRQYQNFKSATSDVDITGLIHENRPNQDKESAKDSKGSLKIANLMGMPEFNYFNQPESSVRDNLGFDQLLDKIRAATQVLGLFTEAQQKVYPQDIQQTLKWVSSYYSGAEPLSPMSMTRKTDYRKPTLNEATAKAKTLGVDHFGSQVFGSSQNIDYVYKHSAHSVTPLSNTDITPPGHRRASAQVGISNTLTQAANIGFKPILTQAKSSQNEPPHKPFSVLIEPPRQDALRGGNTATRLGTLENQLSTNRDLMVTEEAGGAFTVPTQQEEEPNKVRVAISAMQKNTMPHHKMNRPKGSVLGRMMTNVKSSAKSITSALSRRLMSRPKVPSLHESTEARRIGNETQHHGRSADVTKMEAMAETKPIDSGMLGVPEQHPEILLSSNKANIQALVRAVAFFSTTAKKPMEAAERNESISTTSTTSNNRTILKSIQTTLKTRKHGTVVFLFTAVLSLFSVYFFSMCEYIIARMEVYNKSNLNNFLLVSSWIFLNRKQLQGCEVADELVQFLSTFRNISRYTETTQTFSKIVSGITYTDYLLTRLKDAQIDSRQALAEVTRFSTFVIDVQNAVDFQLLMAKSHPIGYIDRLATSLDPAFNISAGYFQTIWYYQDSFSHLEKVIRQMIADFEGFRNQGIDLFTDKMWASKFEQSRRIVIELVDSIYNIKLTDMISDFDKLFDTMVQGDIDEHLDEAYLIIIISGVVLGLAICLGFYAVHKISIIQRSYLDTYSFLKIWELHVTLEDLSTVEDSFSRYMMNEFHMATEYLAFCQRSLLVFYNDRVSGLRDKYAREKSNPKFKHDFTFPSLIVLWLAILSSAVLYGLLCLTVGIVVSGNENRLGMQFLVFDVHKSLINVTKNYLTTAAMPIYGQHMSIAGHSVLENRFNSSVDQFVVLETGKRGSFESYFSGDSSDSFDKVVFEDICSRMQDVAKLADDSYYLLPICRTFNQGSANRGFIGFLQYQKVFLEGMRNKILSGEQSFVQASQTEIPELPLYNYYFSQGMMELRIGNWLFYDLYYYITADLSEKESRLQSDDIKYKIGVVILSVSIVWTLLGCLIYAFIVRKQLGEIRICYETFRMIDPYFLINNKLVQHKFKTSFQGIE